MPSGHITWPDEMIAGDEPNARTRFARDKRFSGMIVYLRWFSNRCGRTTAVSVRGDEIRTEHISDRRPTAVDEKLVGFGPERAHTMHVLRFEIRLRKRCTTVSDNTRGTSFICCREIAEVAVNVRTRLVT